MSDSPQAASDAGAASSATPHPDPVVLSCPPDSLRASVPQGEREDIDPEIAALLDFEPVPRKVKLKDGWTGELQREFIARLAVHGSPSSAAGEVGKDVTSARKLYKSPLGESFRSAWDAAVELAERRIAERTPVARIAAGARAPGIDRRRKTPARGPDDVDPSAGLPGQILNEHGEYEDEASYRQRTEEAKDSIGMKLVRCRRAFLAEISGSAGKRAAFEILTELPVDWEIAERLEPQPFEPWTRTNQRQPDMVLTAESGWSFGEIGYGPDKKARARAAIDEQRASEGLPPVDWGAD